MAENDAPIKGSLHWRTTSGESILYLREGDTAEVGREPGNDVVLNSGHVSRRHAVINWREDQFQVADLGSVNGVKINGTLIEGPSSLADGDVMTFYDVDVTFRIPKEKQVEEFGDNADKETFVVSADIPQPRLVISSGVQEGREILLALEPMSIGRATARQAFDIALQDRSVSRPHATIEHTPEGWILTDNGSANGSLVNGEPIHEPTILDDGDVILLGETTLLLRLI